MIKERILKIQQKLCDDEAFIVFYGPNRFYLTGFNSSAGAVLITPKSASFIIDFRYFEKAKKVVKSCNVILSDKIWQQITEILKADKIKTLYVENRTLSLSEFSALKKQLGGFKISEDTTLDDYIYLLRSVKSEGELSLMRKAQALTDEAFEYILNYIRPGKTEKAIALELEFYMRRHGSEGVAFDSIVVSGENSSLPHGTPGDREVGQGDFITMDFGAVIGGYCADMTRTVAVGEISDRQKLVYDTVLNAQLEAMKHIKTGAVCREIDAVARDLIDNCGFEGCFGHSLGHSLGIQVHEAPGFNLRDNTVLVSGMVLSVEPGIYLENEFGVRIEDVVCVTNGGFENLTKSTKELIIL
ncbi:MAG: aminopeptidase P family protein [Clostridia bacterium]|nr:aminopeptidase P family protein [Clostridia bacterium]